jgi:hypothetical protein
MEPLRLHRSIYPPKAISDTVKAFEELLQAEMVKEGEYQIITLRPLGSEHSPATLRHEFANYALGRAARSR